MSKEQISASLEDYLEAIYKIIEEKHGVKAVEVSRRLGVGRSSVTEALKTLAGKKLVNYGRYDVISLTPEGEKAALKVILKHNVLYEFFANILGVNSEEAHENACRVEHVISEDILKRFTLFIEFNKRFNCQNHNYIEEFSKFYEEMDKK
ncbi:MAG: metal-dependent transcriptional regulator [Candidatus Gastranaerophilaceae bacterium]